MQRLLFLAAFIILLLGAALYLTPPPEVVIGGSSSKEEPALQKNQPVVPSLNESTASLDDIQTFKGAQVDGALRTDHRDRLVIDMQLRHWLDFHLSAVGELDIDDIKTLMQRQMRELPQPGQQQALTLLDAYMGYLAALENYDREEAGRLVEPQISDMEARFRWQQRLRREWLEPLVVEAFFAGEESIDTYTLAAQRLRRDGASAAQLSALEETLPQPIKDMRAESRQVIHLSASESRLQEQGASSAEIQQWREQQYGIEAAKRLETLDKKQNQWRQRLKDYQSYQQSLSDRNVSEHEQQRLLETYRQQHFDQSERKRIDAAIILLD